MNDLILETGSGPRHHRKRLMCLLEGTTGILRIASAYVTDRELLLGNTDRERRLLISLLSMDIASGATKLEALGAIINSGAECRVLPDRPRLHAKVYIFGTEHGVITSANLTGSGFDSNIEVGVAVKHEEVKNLTAWFDRLWGIAAPLKISQLCDLQQKTASLRREYVKFRRKTKIKLQVPKKPKPHAGLSDSLQDLFSKAERFFVCNTHRRHPERTPTGGYALEEEMHNRGLATAWESFKYPSHMEEAEPGDAVFMFAKDVGIIGVGVALAKCQKLSFNDPDRIRDFPNEENTLEWRVPVRWLDWKDDAEAYQWKSPNCTFCDVSTSKYEGFREEVRTHFLSES